MDSKGTLIVVLVCVCLAYQSRAGQIVNLKRVSGSIRAELREPCDVVSNPCTGVGQTCDEGDTGKCTCDANHYPDPDTSQCLLKGRLGAPCDDSNPCAGDNQVCAGYGEDKKCSCKTESVENGDSTACLVKAELGEDCEDNYQCVGTGQTCDRGATNKCICDANHYDDPSGAMQCFKKGGQLGSPCDDSNPCTGANQECTGESGNKRCVCQADSIENAAGTACLARAELGGDCEDNYQCVGTGQTCDIGATNKCVCDTSHYQDPADDTRCLLKGGLGSPCDETNACTGEGTECAGDGADQKCTCSSDHVENGEGSACLRKVGLGGDCEINEQCHETGQTCDFMATNTCICDANHYDDPSGALQCLKKGEQLGSPCDYITPCTGANQECAGESGDQRCACQADSIENAAGTACLARAELGGDCEDNSQCGGTGQTCDIGASDKCVCDSSHYDDPSGAMQCLKKGEQLGSPCDDDSECTGEGQACADDGIGSKICVCESDYVESGDRTGCLIIKNQINDTCQETQQCAAGSLGEMAECLNERCQCGGGSSYSDGECSTAPGLGDVCHSHEECVLGVNEYSICTPSSDFTFRCSCIPEAIEADNTCRLRRVGDDCEVNADCTASIADGVECDDCTGTCECKFGYKASADGSACTVRVCRRAGFSFK